MLRLLRGTAGQITAEFRGVNGALVDPSPATPPVSVADSSGAVVSTGNAAKVSTGIYSFQVTPTVTASLDTFTATWTPTIAGLVNTYTTTFEVAGGFYFSLAEMRAYNSSLLGSASVFSDAFLIEKRQIVEELFERNLYYACVPRGLRVRLDGTGSNFLQLPTIRARRIVSITADSVAYTNADLATVVLNANAGYIQRTSGSFSGINPGNIVVYLEHGLDQPPEPIKEAGLEYLRHLALPNNEDERVLSITNEMGATTRLAQPSLRFPTGIPRVDAVLARYSDKYLHVG